MKSKKGLSCTLWFLLPALLLGCSPCDEEIIFESHSPDNTHTAVASYRECGAIARDATHIIVRPNSKGSNETEQVIFGARNQQTIELSWKSPSELTVRCAGCRADDITFQVSKVGGLRITYELP